MPFTQILVQKQILSRRDGRTQQCGGLRRYHSPPIVCHNSHLEPAGTNSQGLRTLNSQFSTRQHVAFPEVSSQPESAGLVFSRPASLAAACSTLMTAGTAAAHYDMPDMSCMHPAWVENASLPLDAVILADLSLLPSLNGQPFQILGFLLNHPFITLALALTINYVVPRAFRAVVRFLVFPLMLGSIAWVALQNPSTAWSFLQGAFDFVTHHTIETSAVILIGLSFLLSPYLLVGGAVFLLVFGIPNVPAFMRPLVPAPLLEVQKRADAVQRGLQGPLKALGDGFGSTADGIQKTFGVKILR